MPTIDLLIALQFYVSLLNKLTEQELSVIHDGQFSKTVSLQYNTINLRLDVRDTVNAHQLYLQAGFQINGQTVTCKEIYCRNEGRGNELRSLVLAETPEDGFVWRTNRREKLYNQEIEKYLSIADEIAKRAYRCSSGDDYYPGYFSEISITDNEIVLKQINYHNSRSINHKNDYYLRDLKFYIPLQPVREGEPGRGRIGFDEYRIGDMTVYFSERSSEQNRSCGNAIRDNIVEEMDRFKDNQLSNLQ